MLQCLGDDGEEGRGNKSYELFLTSRFHPILGAGARKTTVMATVMNFPFPYTLNFQFPSFSWCSEGERGFMNFLYPIPLTAGSPFILVAPPYCIYYVAKYSFFPFPKTWQIPFSALLFLCFFFRFRKTSHLIFSRVLLTTLNKRSFAYSLNNFFFRVACVTDWKDIILNYFMLLKHGERVMTLFIFVDVCWNITKHHVLWFCFKFNE